MNFAAVVCSAIVWVVVGGDPEVESLRREVESLKSVVVSLRDVCDLHSSKIRSLQETLEEQQKSIEKQQVLIEKLLSENQDLKNKSRNLNFKRTGLVDQKSEKIGEHDMYDNTRVIRGYQESSHEGLLAKDQRNSLYVFTWTIREHDGSQHSVALVINNEEYGAIYQKAQGGEYDQCSTTVVLYLNQGDDVYLRTKHGVADGNLPMTSNQWGRTSFSGWKIN